MNSNILTSDELKELTGCERLGDVQRYLDQSGIRYFTGRKRIWTTLALVDAAGGIVNNQQQDNESVL